MSKKGAISYKDAGTEDIFNLKKTKKAGKTCPERLWKLTIRKLELLDSVVNLHELRIPPGNRFEALKGDRSGQYSIRINDQYSICFKWQDNGPAEVEIIDCHKG